MNEMLRKHVKYWRTWIGVLFLSLQVGMIVRARFVDNRTWCWAPHDMQTEYFLEVTCDGRSLTGEETFARYGLLNHGWDSHSWADVICVLETYHHRHGRSATEIQLRYRVNGGSAQRWSYP